MLFNSFNFLIFLPVVFIAYWIIGSKHLKLQNLFLLMCSYFFYSCWDYRFVFLLAFSTFLDYSTGIKIYESKTTRGKKRWLLLSVIINLDFLAVFKSYNFFAESFSAALLNFGFKTNPGLINVVLPIGISFYTFHGLSYVFDIYKQRIAPVRNIIDYSVFVSFFPLLVAGPIERATHLLPQIQNERNFNYRQAVDGLRQILWGFFKKVVIADNCAEFANLIFKNYSHYPGSTLVLGVFFFAIQIYCDFSGYSDIALGCARLFGIELIRNFAFPYFSRDIAEFWRRWHISLSSWFRDYLYIPLGGSRVSSLFKIRNLFIIFIISGFWHGANWTFIIWGALNALYMVPVVLLNRNRNNLDIVAKGKLLPGLKELFQMITTFILVLVAWVFFRSENLSVAVQYLERIFSRSIFVPPSGSSFIGSHHPFTVMTLIIIMFMIEWTGREQQYALAELGTSWRKPLRWTFYIVLLVTTFYFSAQQQQFIYFQF